MWYLKALLKVLRTRVVWWVFVLAVGFLLLPVLAQVVYIRPIAR
jgi:hypothetical protein